MVLGIHHQQVARRVAADGLGSAPRCRDGRPAVARISELTCSRYGRQCAVGIHLADAIALALGDVGDASTVGADRSCAEDAGLCCGEAVAAALLGAVAGEGGDDARIQVDAPNALVLHVCDQQAAAPVEVAVVGFAELGVNGRSAVAAIGLLAVARNGGDSAGGCVDLAYHVVQPVDHVHIAVYVNLQRIGLVEGSLGRRTSVTGVPLGARSRNGDDDAGIPVDPAHAVVHRLGDIQVAGGVKGAHERLAHQRGRRRAAVPCISSLAGPGHGGNDARFVNHGRSRSLWTGGSWDSILPDRVISRSHKRLESTTATGGGISRV